MSNTETPAKTESPEYTKNGYLRYQVLLVVLFPVLLIYTVFLAVKFRSLNYLLQRMGFFTRPEQPTDIWLHAASVGEVNAAIPLLKVIEKNYPDKKFLVTTATPTGAAVFKQRQLKNAVHQFLPLDYGFMVSSLLRQYQPKCVLILETEIWPNLFRICHRKDIPLCTVNGRLSNKTLDAGGWIRSLFQLTLQYSSLILARSDADAKAYIALGANPAIVKTVGNLKFSADINTHRDIKFTLNQAYVLAASTHANEELMIARLWKDRDFSQFKHLLVIVPRHPHRLNDILGQLRELQLNIAVRSRNDSITESTDIYIADTVGELTDFIAGADIIFMGGSLAPIGGHNILEPAALGKPVLFGPYMDNFENEAELLTGFSGAIQVDDIEKLGDTLEEALKFPEKFAQLGSKAKHIIEQHKDTADRYVAELTDCLNND